MITFVCVLCISWSVYRMRPLHLWVLAFPLWTNNIVLAVEDERCKQKSSEFGAALLGRTYKKISAADFPTCLHMCNQDDQCLSANFEMIKLVCELNNQTKVTYPRGFVQKRVSIYMDSTVRDPLPGKNWFVVIVLLLLWL